MASTKKSPKSPTAGKKNSVGFFCQLPKKTTRAIAKRAKDADIKQWEVVVAAIDTAAPQWEGEELGGLRRKARKAA